MTANQASAEHVRQLARLIEELASAGIDLYEHHYEQLSFGNFLIVVGRPHERVRFAWDGRDSVLAVACRRLTNLNGLEGWTHDAYISVPNGEGLWVEIASEAQSMLRSRDGA